MPAKDGGKSDFAGALSQCPPGMAEILNWQAQFSGSVRLRPGGIRYLDLRDLSPRNFFTHHIYLCYLNQFGQTGNRWSPLALLTRRVDT
jgi:hypothetical protein